MELYEYKGIDSIVNDNASNAIVEGCLVLEGGAFRGLYTSGCLDALMLYDINMRCTIGVSAGALNGVNYTAGQIGRAARINLMFRHDSRYVGLTAYKRNKGVIGFDFLLNDPDGVEPLNKERFMDPKRRFIAVATDCVNARPVYFEKGYCRNILKAVQASASMPYVSKMVKINGGYYLDGGCSDKIPYLWPYKQGYKKVILIKTRDKNYRKTKAQELPDIINKNLYKDYPDFIKLLENNNNLYNAQLDGIDKLASEKKIFVLEPSQPVTISRLEGNIEKLGELYQLGFNDTLNRMKEIKEYLNS